MPLPPSVTSPRLQPGWTKVCAVLCAATVVVTFLGDLFVPAARAVEVWLGFETTGTVALATAPIHWTLFAIAAWAFWTGRMWIVPWAAGYLFYAAVSHVVWSEASAHGRGWQVGIVQALVIAFFGLVLLQLRALDAPGRR